MTLQRTFQLLHIIAFSMQTIEENHTKINMIFYIFSLKHNFSKYFGTESLKLVALGRQKTRINKIQIQMHSDMNKNISNHFMLFSLPGIEHRISLCLSFHLVLNDLPSLFLFSAIVTFHLVGCCRFLRFFFISTRCTDKIDVLEIIDVDAVFTLLNSFKRQFQEILIRWKIACCRITTSMQSNKVISLWSLLFFGCCDR